MSIGEMDWFDELEAETLAALDDEGGRGKRWKRRRKRRPPIRIKPPSTRAQPGQTCPNWERIRLQQIVNRMCKGPAQRQSACREGMSCSQLSLHAKRAMQCAQARALINRKCFGGGNAGHRQAQAEALANVAGCRKHFWRQHPEDAKVISLKRGHRQFFD